MKVGDASFVTINSQKLFKNLLLSVWDTFILSLLSENLSTLERLNHNIYGLWIANSAEKD